MPGADVKEWATTLHIDFGCAPDLQLAGTDTEKGCWEAWSRRTLGLAGRLPAEGGGSGGGEACEEDGELVEGMVVVDVTMGLSLGDRLRWTRIEWMSCVEFV